MSAQQNQLKDLTEEDFSFFTNLYSYTPVSFVWYYYTYHMNGAKDCSVISVTLWPVFF